MAVDNAGDDKLSRGVNDLSVFGSTDGLADLDDFAILNKDGTVLDGSMRDGKDGGVSMRMTEGASGGVAACARTGK
jgi:hypothetical protein